MGDRSKTINQIIGQRIKDLRLKKGLTQRDLSKIVNKGDSTTRMWELGLSEPDLETTIILANFFDITIDYLVGRDIHIDRIAITDEEVQLLSGFRSGKYEMEKSDILAKQKRINKL